MDSKTMSYKKLSIKGKKIDEHRHMMQVHLGRKLTRYEVVHHEDEIKSHNEIGNFKVMSLSEHSRMHRIGKKFSTDTLKTLRNRGIETMHVNKLSVSDVKEIKQSLLNKAHEVELAKKYNVSRTAINDIKTGRTWSHIKNLTPYVKVHNLLHADKTVNTN
jgi:hypothetical protein